MSSSVSKNHSVLNSGKHRHEPKQLQQEAQRSDGQAQQADQVWGGRHQGPDRQDVQVCLFFLNWLPARQNGDFGRNSYFSLIFRRFSA